MRASFAVSGDTATVASTSREGGDMPGKFVLKKRSGGYHFNLPASNGRVIASSEHYESRAAALGGIESIRTNAAGGKLVEEAPAAPEAKQPIHRQDGVRQADGRRPRPVAVPAPARADEYPCPEGSARS
jgi:uncharacterized protein YegP (UPF0339 family)